MGGGVRHPEPRVPRTAACMTPPIRVLCDPTRSATCLCVGSKSTRLSARGGRSYQYRGRNLLAPRGGSRTLVAFRNRHDQTTVQPCEAALAEPQQNSKSELGPAWVNQRRSFARTRKHRKAKGVSCLSPVAQFCLNQGNRWWGPLGTDKWSPGNRVRQ